MFPRCRFSLSSLARYPWLVRWRRPMTGLVNGPVIHGIYRHAYKHIRKGKFGRDHCTAEYQLAIRQPTGSRYSVHQQSEEQHLAHEEPQEPRHEEEPQHEEELQHEEHPPHGGEHKPSGMSDIIRKSVSSSKQSCSRGSNLLGFII